MWIEMGYFRRTYCNKWINNPEHMYGWLKPLCITNIHVLNRTRCISTVMTAQEVLYYHYSIPHHSELSVANSFQYRCQITEISKKCF